MTSLLFRKAIIISLFSHVSVMCVLNLSAGPRPALVHYASINFFNGIIPAYEHTVSRVFTPVDIGKIFLRRPNTAILDNNRQVIFEPSYYVKPQVFLSAGPDKVTPSVPLPLAPRGVPKKEPVVMFYPSLPAHLLLYFTDRQTVHIELQYTISSSDTAGTISLRRKISSGNLEADLLAMRYISHYLFIQRSRLPSDSWQTVQIEFSPKHDQP